MNLGLKWGMSRASAEWAILVQNNLCLLCLRINRFFFKLLAFIWYEWSYRKMSYQWVNSSSSWGKVIHMCLSKLGHHCLGKWPVSSLTPGHYMNLCMPIIKWSLVNKFQWNFNPLRKMHLKMLSTNWHPFCSGLSLLIHWGWDKTSAIF